MIAVRTEAITFTEEKYHPNYRSARAHLDQIIKRKEELGLRPVPSTNEINVYYDSVGDRVSIEILD